MSSRECECCKNLRAQIVETLESVDTTDWNSYDGGTQRTVGAVLKDIASRLQALGEKDDKG